MKTYHLEYRDNKLFRWRRSNETPATISRETILNYAAEIVETALYSVRVVEVDGSRVTYIFWSEFPVV